MIGGRNKSVLNEVLNGKRPVSTEYALMLEAVLGIDASIWLRLQMDYNMQVTKAKHPTGSQYNLYW